ncbi:hypothetical protein K9M74_00390 [Candidatus Woesearchaeota archaeon]|nr:hypothetical protein [Candidatus Woesearchaeota archaeon]
MWKDISTVYPNLSPTQKSWLIEFAKFYFIKNLPSKKKYVTFFSYTQKTTIRTYLGPYQYCVNLVKGLNAYTDYMVTNGLEHSFSSSDRSNESTKKSLSKEKINGKKNNLNGCKSTIDAFVTYNNNNLVVDSSDVGIVSDESTKKELLHELFSARYNVKVLNALEDFFDFIEQSEDLSFSTFKKYNRRAHQNLKKQFYSPALVYKQTYKFFSELYSCVNWPKFKQIEKMMYE